MLQCFNSVLLHDTLPVDLPHFDFSFFLVFNPGDLYYLEYKEIVIIIIFVARNYLQCRHGFAV